MMSTNAERKASVSARFGLNQKAGNDEYRSAGFVINEEA